jgi:hypothetical protein
MQDICLWIIFFRFEHQIVASKNRKNNNKAGRQPDIIFEVEREGKTYELLYGECSRLICTSQKVIDDNLKL